MRESPRNVDRMPTLSHGCQATGYKTCQGLPSGLSVGHRGSFQEAWTLASCGWLRMIIMEGWNERAVDPTLLTRRVFGIFDPQSILKPRAVCGWSISHQKRDGDIYRQNSNSIFFLHWMPTPGSGWP